MMPAPRSPQFTLPTLLAISALSLAVLSGCSDSKKAPPAMAPLPVSVLELQPQRIPASFEVMGQTEGARETEVRARVGGILVKRLYQEGETVKAGQPMFQIDRSSYEIAVADAKARAEQTARELKRLKPLLEARAISQKTHDDAQSANEIAQATLRQAELDLSWTTVNAPVGGVTGRAVKSEGNLISVGNDSLLTSIYQTNPIWVSFSLGDSDLAKLAGGRASAKNIRNVQLVLADGSTYEQPGKLNFTASTIDTTLGTQALRAEFTNPANRLLPGQFVRVRLSTEERDGVFLVPQAAVVQNEQGTMVMLADADNKVAPRPVQVAEWLGRNWVVTGGLKAGERVIVDNLMKLRPGAPVAPKAPAADGAPATPPATATATAGKS